ncbi:Na+/H+ antiporter subunit E [Devosia sp.]|uniref:Na+/H+ antiporter subunit E n=1 Tax=Devosia sp. TaxID=1871048 RepID=UPI002EFBA16F
MTRVFAYPLLWLALLGMWLALSGSLGVGQILLGAGVASLACWAVATVAPPRPRLRRPGSILRLFLLVLADVARSNLQVLALALGRREPRSAFVSIPLTLTEPNGLAVLACIVTATPGSAWIDYRSATGEVLIHVLDTDDPQAWAAELKRTYESLLLEIFQ